MFKSLRNKFLSESCHPIGLATFRFLFGSIMFISGLRFIAKGWIQEFYLEPKFHFKYYGFEWVDVLPEYGLYLVFGLLLFSALGIALGFLYRLNTILFFLCFTYIELLDKTLYLNHYYFVSLIGLLLIFIPANNYASLDVYLGIKKPQYIKRFYVLIIQIQIAVLYFFAGVAKINTDWLFHGQPMDIWLDKYHYLPVIGSILSLKSTAIFCSWFGMLYDISLPFLLWGNKTRKWAYLAVVVFHLATALLFPIGVFPFVMIGATLIFFPPVQFQKLKCFINRFKKHGNILKTQSVNPSKAVIICLSLHLLFQVLFPLRHLLYKGNVLWTEEGFNFSWRVMLVEKSGVANFFVPTEDNFIEVRNSLYLSPLQEKMMSTQADFMLQYAHFIAKEYKADEVYCDAFVTLNGRPPQRYINQTTNLVKEHDSFATKTYIIPLKTGE